MCDPLDKIQYGGWYKLHEVEAREKYLREHERTGEGHIWRNEAGDVVCFSY